MGERSGFIKVVLGGVCGKACVLGGSKVGLEIKDEEREHGVSNIVSGECNKALETFPNPTSESPRPLNWSPI